MKGNLKMKDIEEKAFRFYVRWVQISAISMSFMGLVIVFSNIPIVQDFFYRAIFSSFWSQVSEIGADTSRYIHFSMGIMGALMVMWGILLYGIVCNAYSAKQSWAWKTILWSTLGWFIIDETFSIYYRVWINAISNVIFFAMLVLPLILSRKYITK